MVNIHEPGALEGRLAQWPVLAVSGALEVRLAETEAEVEQAQRLRYRVFYEEMSAIPSPKMRETRRDFDRFDEFCAFYDEHGALTMEPKHLGARLDPDVVEEWSQTMALPGRLEGCSEMNPKLLALTIVSFICAMTPNAVSCP